MFGMKIGRNKMRNQQMLSYKEDMQWRRYFTELQLERKPICGWRSNPALTHCNESVTTRIANLCEGAGRLIITEQYGKFDSRSCGKRVVLELSKETVVLLSLVIRVSKERAIIVSRSYSPQPERSAAIIHDVLIVVTNIWVCRGRGLVVPVAAIEGHERLMVGSWMRWWRNVAAWRTTQTLQVTVHLGRRKVLQLFTLLNRSKR